MYNYLATTLIEHTKIDWTFEHHILAIVVYQVIYWRKYIIKITYEYNSIKLLNVYINARSWKDFNLKTKRLLPLETKDWSCTDEHHINLASLVANSEQWSCRNSSGSESVLKPSRWRLLYFTPTTPLSSKSSNPWMRCPIASRTIRSLLHKVRKCSG
jgi:hypothetical protein